MEFVKWIAVFVGMFALDWAWATYTMAAADRKALAASLASVVIAVVGAAVTVAYVYDWWLLIPVACGCFAGTYSAVKFGDAENL